MQDACKTTRLVIMTIKQRKISTNNKPRGYITEMEFWNSKTVSDTAVRN